MAPLIDRLLDDDESDGEVDLQARQERADETLQGRIDPEAHDIDDGVVPVAVWRTGRSAATRRGTAICPRSLTPLPDSSVRLF